MFPGTAARLPTGPGWTRLTGNWLLGLSFGWPPVSGGALKILYDLLPLRQFRAVRPPEELAPTRSVTATVQWW